MFESDNKKPIFNRPNYHARLCPPPLKLPNLSNLCSVCLKNVEIHSENHFTLHVSSCEICEHIDFISKNSCKLICHVCLKKFSRKDTLDQHLNIHTTNNTYFCDDCSIGFSSRYNFERHLEEKHSTQEQIYQCDHCEVKLASQRNLDTPMKDIHRNIDVQMFHCDLCEKSYPQRRFLARHKRIIHNVDNSKATLPGTSSKNKNIFQCNSCESTFTQRSDLDRHIKTHHSKSHEENISLCKTCHKSFQRKDYLKKHEQIHIKAKIICEICLDQFQDKKDLKLHRITNHENK